MNGSSNKEFVAWLVNRLAGVLCGNATYRGSQENQSGNDFPDFLLGKARSAA